MVKISESLNLDAAGDPRHIPFLNSFKKYANASIVKHEGGIQYDGSSCPIFSIQHLNNLSHTSLNEPDSSQKGVLSLSPLFLKNIQSTSSLEEYYRIHHDQTIDKKQNKTLKSHIDAYSITVDVANAVDPATTKTKTLNYSIAYKTHKYLLAALDQLIELETHGADVQEVIDSRNNCDDKNLSARTVELCIHTEYLI